MRVKLFCNPVAGRGRARRELERVAAHLRTSGHEVESAESQSSQHLSELAASIVPGSYDRIAVIGGDGTLHHFLRGLPLSIPLGIIASGSGDDFAATLGLPSNPLVASDVVMKGKVRQVDVVEANGIRYAGVGGVGFDSMVAKYANEHTRFVRGSLLYLWAILQVLPSFQPIHLKMNVDGQKVEEEVMFAVVANSHRYGAGIQIAPTAKIDDGILDVYLTLRCSKGKLLRTLPQAYSGKHVTNPLVKHLRGTEITLDSNQPLDLYADGELVTKTPATVRLAKEKLSVYVA